MSRRRWLVGAAVAVAVLFALVPLGRWERARADSTQLNGLARTEALVGDPLTSRRLAAYRLTAKADCLLYWSGGDPYAVELCFDPLGRLIETIDRRDRARTRIASIRFDPALDRHPVSPAGLFRLLQRVGAIGRDARFRGRLPLLGDLPHRQEVDPGDTGPILVRRAQL